MYIAINKTMPAKPLVVSRKHSKVLETGLNTEAVILRPGVNQVDSDTVDSLKDSATVSYWLKTGMLELRENKKTKDGKDEAGLNGFDETLAISLVMDCFDMSLLRKFKEQDKRENVRVAILERLSDLAKAIKVD